MKFHDSYFRMMDTPAKRKIVQFLLKNETPMSEREIASLTGVSHMTVNRILRDLEEWNCVSFQRLGRAHVWMVNRHSYAFRVLEDLGRMMRAIPDPLDALKEILLGGLPLKNILKVILFGSIAKAQEDTASDIDVFILVPDQKSAELTEEAIGSLSVQCLQTFGNRLSPYVLTKRQYEQKRDLKLMNDIREGLQLFPIGE